MNRLLKLFRLATSRGCNLQKEAEVIKKLVSKYTSHEFVIDFEEAVALGMNATEMGDDEEDIFSMVIDTLSTARGIGGKRLDFIEFFRFEPNPVIMQKQEISLTERPTKR